MTTQNLSGQDLLDWERLKTWTESKPVGEILGESCTNTLCPIAAYLYQQTGKWWSVGPSIKPMDGSRTRLEKPEWVDSLISQVDLLATNGEKNWETGSLVTREQFLQCLDEVKP